MRGNKRLVQGIAVAGMTGALVLTVALPQQQIMQTEETIKTMKTVQATSDKTSGVMTSMITDEQMNEIIAQAMTVEKNDVYRVSASSIAGRSVIEKPAIIENADDVAKEKTQKEKKNTKSKAKETEKENNNKENKKNKDSETKEEKSVKTDQDTKKDKKNEKKTSEKDTETKEMSAKEKKWNNRLMADVERALNIRESADKDSAVVGKLRKGDVAKVLEKGKKWTKIKSGSVVGYVKNTYCVYGLKAYKMANKVCDTVATVQADGLRIRQKAHEEAVILRAAEEGDQLVVNEKAKEKDGWVAVKVGGTKGYVSADYVEVELGTGKAITIEEEQAQLAAQKEAEQSAAVQASSSDSSAASSSAVQVSSSDLTLLSAIIFCEAGGESYAGQVAVGAVVMNRVKSSAYPNSISGVVYQSGQFSPVANGALARALSNGSYQNCVSAARAALAGSDNTGGAKYFHRVNGAPGLVIGNHVFY